MDLVINGRFLTQSVTGVQRYARELLQAMDVYLGEQTDIKATVLHPKLSGSLPTWRNIIPRQVGSLSGHAWEQFELPWYSHGKLLFCPGNTAPIVSLLARQPVVVTVHDLSFQHFPDAYSLAFRLVYGLVVPLALSRASAVITVSESERASMLARYPGAASRLYVISNGGLPAEIQPQLSSNPASLADREYILYAGSRSRHKNFDGVLETAVRLVRKRRFRFVFVGGVAGGIVGDDLKIPEDVAPNITFAGRVDDATLFKYYGGAKCFLFPSFYEASGLPPIEAMAFGCPAIVSDIPALKERCGDAAIYCDPHNIDSITAAIEQVMDNPALQLKLQTLGYQRAAGFTWADCAHRTLKVIRKASQAA